MSGYSTLEVHKAIYDRLTGNAPLMAAIAGVFDNVKQCQTFPFAVIGEISGKDFSTHTHQGMEQSVMIHTWSQASGRLQSRQIMKQIYDLLHRWNATLPNHDNVVLMFDMEDLDIDPDGVTYHGVMRFKWTTLEN